MLKRHNKSEVRKILSAIKVTLRGWSLPACLKLMALGLL